MFAHGGEKGVEAQLGSRKADISADESDLSVPERLKVLHRLAHGAFVVGGNVAEAYSDMLPVHGHEWYSILDQGFEGLRLDLGGHQDDPIDAAGKHSSDG